MEFACVVTAGMRAPCRDASRVRSVKGGWRAEKRKILWLVPCGTRAPRGAPITAFPAPGPRFRPVRRASNRADRAVSQLLAGTPSGPGGSSAAARVPRCDEARGRRTPSRLRNASRERPSDGRGVCSLCEVWKAGISARPRRRPRRAMRIRCRWQRFGGTLAKRGANPPEIAFEPSMEPRKRNWRTP